MVSDKETDDVTEEIYQSFGSSTGYLFGLHPRNRDEVRAVVEATLIVKERRKNG